MQLGLIEWPAARASWIHVVGPVDGLSRAGGKLAAPPDDCGGIWGYQEVLSDPIPPDYEDRLE